mmetsp:Transcript_2886/g.10451  ORF Transcript_2886/g.10451 Transcript_2886/m.10451 type:complete len:216 (+) Transcript_2886:1589-2236(+)
MQQQLHSSLILQTFVPSAIFQHRGPPQLFSNSGYPLPWLRMRSNVHLYLQVWVVLCVVARCFRKSRPFRRSPFGAHPKTKQEAIGERWQSVVLVLDHCRTSEGIGFKIPPRGQQLRTRTGTFAGILNELLRLQGCLFAKVCEDSWKLLLHQRGDCGCPAVVHRQSRIQTNHYLGPVGVVQCSEDVMVSTRMFLDQKEPSILLERPAYSRARPVLY